MIKKTYFILSIILCLLYSERSVAQARYLLVGTTESNIQKRASSQKPPLWKIPVGPSLAESMEMIGPDRLLVALKKDFPGLPDMDYMLINTQNGETIWTYDRKGNPGEYKLFLVFSDMLVFRVEKTKSVELLALHPETGAEIWRAELKGKNIIPIPVFSHSQIVMVNRGENDVALTAISFKDGKTVWEQTREVSNSSSLPLPAVNEDYILLFYNGVEKISPENGEAIYSKKELNFVADAPAPAIEGDTLFAVINGNKLTAVAADNGNTLWS